MSQSKPVSSSKQPNPSTNPSSKPAPRKPMSKTQEAKACLSNAFMTSQLLKIAPSKLQFYQDEPITGEVILTPYNPISLKDIVLKLIVAQAWIVEEKDHTEKSETSHKSIFELPLEVLKQLNKTGDVVEVDKGEYKFNFKIDLKKSIDPSFEHPFPSKRAFIRYILVAEIISPYTKAKCEAPIIILTNPVILTSPCSNYTTHKVRQMGLINKGKTTLTVTYSSTNYKVMSKMPVKIIIDNSECQLPVKETKIVVVRNIEFRNPEMETKCTIEKKIFSHVYKTLVEERQKKDYIFDIDLSDELIKEYNYKGVFNPYLAANINLNMFFPTFENNMFVCNYHFKVTVYFDSFVKNDDRPRIIMPLTITHRIKKEYETWKAQIAKAAKASMNNNNIGGNVMASNMGGSMMDLNAGGSLMNSNMGANIRGSMMESNMGGNMKGSMMNSNMDGNIGGSMMGSNMGGNMKQNNENANNFQNGYGKEVNPFTNAFVGGNPYGDNNDFMDNNLGFQPFGQNNMNNNMGNVNAFQMSCNNNFNQNYMPFGNGNGNFGNNNSNYMQNYGNNCFGQQNNMGFMGNNFMGSNFGNIPMNQ